MSKRTGIDRMVRGSTGEVVNIARRQIFSSADRVGPVPHGVPRRKLQRVLCELLESEINAGLQTFAFDTFRVSKAPSRSSCSVRRSTRSQEDAARARRLPAFFTLRGALLQACHRLYGFRRHTLSSIAPGIRAKGYRDRAV
jgi:hypothetical protein